MNPAHLLVIDRMFPRELPWMHRVIAEAMDSRHPGLPSHMREAVYECGREADSIVSYWWMCLIAVQARPATDTPHTIMMRRELEEIFSSLLFGPSWPTYAALKARTTPKETT